MENPDELENKQAEPALSQAIKKSKMKKKKQKKLTPKQKALVSGYFNTFRVLCLIFH